MVEIAPAPELEAGLRSRILDDAIRLARAADYVNAGTIEFLVLPERGEHFFIECNPRIQVEHTVTEQVTGIDLVESQFRIAAGEALKALGIPDQAAVEEPRDFAVQARIVATGSGVLTAYKAGGSGLRIVLRLSGLRAAAAIRPDVRKANLSVESDAFVRLGARPRLTRAG